MDPALVLAAVVASTFLLLWVLVSVPGFVRRVAAVRVPLAPGPIAGIVAGSLLFAAVLRERPARAETPPPIVRLATPAADRPPPGVPAAVESATTVGYLVVVGDSLWEIARRHLEAGTGERPSSTEIDRFWRAIYAANRAVVGPDPNLIFPGQQLQIPKG